MTILGSTSLKKLGFVITVVYIILNIALYNIYNDIAYLNIIKNYTRPVTQEW